MSRKKQSNGNDDIIIKTEQRELVRIPVFQHELDSIGQMNKVQSISLNVLCTALGGALGSAPSVFDSDKQHPAGQTSLIIFWSCVAVVAVSGIFALFSWVSNRNTKNGITGSGS